MSYAADHAGAYADLLADGAPVTFTFALVVPGNYQPDTDTFASGTTTNVTGAAIQVSARALQYQALGLIPGEAPTLLFAPRTYGQTPPLGASVVWGGSTYTVRNVEPLAPDGTAILCRVVVAR